DGSTDLILRRNCFHIRRIGRQELRSSSAFTAHGRRNIQAALQQTGMNINMKIPHEAIRARLDEIGYHDPSSSTRALHDMQTIVVNLRLGELMVSRKVVDANGVEGILTGFRK